MKAVNSFPVNSLSGTAQGQDPKNYYSWRGQQIVRKKGGNKGSPSNLFSQNTMYTNISTNLWLELSDERKLAWDIYSEKLNRSETKNRSETNAYTAFKTVNYYSWFVGLAGWQLDPPHLATFFTFSVKNVYTDPMNPNFIRITFTCSGQDENSYIYIKSTRPNSGFLHSFRRSEIKPICESQILSFAHPSLEETQFDYECYITQYSFIGTCSFWLEAIGIGPQWNISKPCVFQCKAIIL